MIYGEKKRALGRGLSALIPQASPPAQEGKGVLRLPLEEVRRDGAQPRKAFHEEGLAGLAESIRSQGVIQPVLVRRDGKGYRLIAGERRWRAAQLAGLKEIPALLREATDADAFEMALVENLQREDLNPIEEAQAYRRLMEERSLTQEQLSQRVGKDRSTVANALRLLGLPEEVRGMLVEGAIDMGHARALLGLGKASEMANLARAVVSERLSVRETERRVKRGRGGSGRKKEARQSPQARSVVEELQRKLGTKVRLHDRGGKGTLEMEFYSYEDLDRLLAILRR
ncbi:MAG: ParB/RepB/Spo0J family partition protein [Myxococcales bacterium]|nr:ParB/RepB/Spo0J family partition protein [Myxococcales bacterium]